MPNSQNDIGNEAPAYGGTGMIDNCIVQSKVVNGQADFFSVSNLNLTLIANATDPFEVSVGGKRVKLTADVVFAVTDAANNFIYIDQNGALSRVATPCTYAYTAPGAPSSGDMWFDLGKNLMKTWNGAAWVASAKVAIGYVRADAGVINAQYACEPIGAYPVWRWEWLGTGADGFLEVSAGTITLNGPKNYTAVVVRSTGKIVHSLLGNTSDPLFIKAQGIVACIGTVGFDLNALGWAGVTGGTGAATGSTNGGRGGSGGGGGGGTNAGSAGGNRIVPVRDVAGGGGTGGGAGGGAAGASTATGDTILDPFYTYGLGGSGGGGGGGSGAANGGNGGRGGGGMTLYAATIVIGASGLVRANGADGTAGAAAGCGGGGGGGGGTLNLASRTFVNNGTFTATGGTFGASGGAGGAVGTAAGTGVASRYSW